MFTAEQYARVRELMCQSHKRCGKCPLDYTQNAEHYTCADFAIKYPAEMVKRVEKWWEENKKRYPQFERGTDK